MIETASVGFITGAVLGLRFNIKMLANCSLLVVIVFGLLAMFGAVSSLGATLHGLVAILSLQTGYFVTLLLAAMGHTNARSAVTDETPLPADTPKTEPAIQSGQSR